MSTELKIVFQHVKGNTIINMDGNSSLKELFSVYANKKGIPSNNLNNYLFLANGESIDSNSNDKVTKLGGENAIILVYENFVNDPFPQENFLKRIKKDKNLNILDIFQEMAISGCLTKKLIQNIMSIKKDSFLLMEEAIQKQNEDPHFFILGLLAKYLTNIGITAVIDRDFDTSNEKYKNLCNTVLQFLANGLIFKKKFYLFFDLPKDIKNDLLINEKEQNIFNDNIKEVLNDLYGVKEIKITKPIPDKKYLVIVILKEDSITFTKDELLNQFIFIPNLCTLSEVKEEKITDGVILNKILLDERGDTEDGKWSFYEKRGNEDYFPPSGWNRFGLNVFNKYDDKNNDWLSDSNKPGEWCVAYGWLTYKQLNNEFNQKYENDNDIKHNGKKVGKGVYCTQNPDRMEELTETFNVNGENYKLGLMLRVKPDKIRCPESDDELWVVEENSDEIRPYGILIKKME